MFKSVILSHWQSFEPINKCQFSPDIEWTLLYRTSQDGFDANNFHSKCDSHCRTLTLFKSAESHSFLYGGYTECTFGRRGKALKQKIQMRLYLVQQIDKINFIFKLLKRKEIFQIEITLNPHSVYQCIKKNHKEFFRVLGSTVRWSIKFFSSYLAIWLFIIDFFWMESLMIT